MNTHLVDPPAHASGDANSLRPASNALSRSITLIVMALAAPLAQSQSVNSELRASSIGELKRVYLACNDAVIDAQLSSQEVMSCSVVYEQLKQHAFDGDFDKLLAWSRLQPSVLKTAMARK